MRFQGSVIVFFKTKINTKHHIKLNHKTKEYEISKHKYFYRSIVCIIFSNAFRLKYYWNMVEFLISTAFTFAMFIKREVLILMWMSKGAFLLEGGAYSRPGAYWRKYGNFKKRCLSCLKPYFIFVISSSSRIIQFNPSQVFLTYFLKIRRKG